MPQYRGLKGKSLLLSSFKEQIELLSLASFLAWGVISTPMFFPYLQATVPSGARTPEQELVFCWLLAKSDRSYWTRPSGGALWASVSLGERQGKTFSRSQSCRTNNFCMQGPQRASLVAQLVKNAPAIWETWVWPLGWEDPPEKGMATHSSILAWRVPCIVHVVHRLSDFHFQEQQRPPLPTQWVCWVGKEAAQQKWGPGQHLKGNAYRGMLDGWMRRRFLSRE